jgi:hypothetical protein
VIPTGLIPSTETERNSSLRSVLQNSWVIPYNRRITKKQMTTERTEKKSNRKDYFYPYKVASHVYSLIPSDLKTLVAYYSVACDLQNQTPAQNIK